MSSNGEKADLVILFGSETGNCEDLAKSIAHQAIERSLRVEVFECDEYNVCQLIDQKLVLFVCSTTGVGEEPNNMKSFWKFIRRKDLPKNSMSSVYISVIGLGDSSYQKYNFVAKKLYKRLIDLGANPLVPLVLGDDQHECGPNATVGPSLQHFWSEVNRVFNVGCDPKSDKSDEPFDASYAVLFHTEGEYQSSEDSNEGKQNESKYHKNNPYLAHILVNERVTSEDHFQDVRHIKLKIDSTKMSYSLGDVCYVKPQNSQQNIDKFLSLLNLDKNLSFILKKNEHNWMSRSSYYNNLPKPCSVETLVTEYLDIQSVPKRSFFDLLYRFSRSDLEKKKLKDFAESNDSDELYEYCNRPKRTIVEVLSDFPNTTPHIPFEYLFDLIPALTPRPFSIASSSLVNPNELHLLVAVVNYRTRLKEPRLGLCSYWLANQLPSNSSIPIHLKKGSFKIGSDSVPFIMIGPGTGVAPFRAFIEERAYRQIADNYLFFGCRYRSSDFYFEEEWKRFRNSGLLEYFVAFSRDTDNKVYVQHILWQQRERVFQLLNQSKAYIYVSGNAKQMPQQIRQTICDIFKDQLKQEISFDEIERMVSNLETKSRIQFECWA